MRRIVAFVLFSAGALGSAMVAASMQRGTTEAPEIAAIKNLERERLAAGVRKDVDAVAAATADDYIQIDVDGNVLNKAAALERIKSSYAKLVSNPVDDMVVRVYGDTAVLTARARPKGILNGKEFGGAMRYTRVYVRRGGRWQVVLFQQTRVTDDR